MQICTLRGLRRVNANTGLVRLPANATSKEPVCDCNFSHEKRTLATSRDLAGGTFITAQLERNGVVYSVVLTKVKHPLSHEDVESHFRGELAKK